MNIGDNCVITPDGDVYDGARVEIVAIYDMGVADVRILDASDASLIGTVEANWDVFYLKPVPVLTLLAEQAE